MLSMVKIGMADPIYQRGKTKDLKGICIMITVYKNLSVHEGTGQEYVIPKNAYSRTNRF